MSSGLRDMFEAAASGIGSAAASAVGTAAGEDAYNCVKNIVNNMRRKPDNEADNDLEDNHRRLKEEAKKLYARRDDILAQTKTKLVNQVCEAWISRVMKSEEEVRELEIKYNDEKSNKKRRSQHGSSKSCTDLSKIIAEKCDELHNLWLEEKSKIGMLVEKLPERVIIMHGPKPEDKPFLHSIVEKILGHLRDKNVKRFGLWGMPGIGKTTIMKSLNNYEDIAKMFDIVIWVTVSKDLSLEKLQHKIADRLKLNTEGITEPEIAQQIWRELKSKRYLLLLDEVWDTLDLSLIGMYGSEMDSKVVLATRYLHVCSDMNTHWELEVKRLSEADAWNMFKVKVGRHFNIPNVESIAKEVVIECAGLPLLIDKVASYFRRMDNIHLWRDGLRRLRRWPSINIQGIGELIECLEFCYENLKDEGQKDCFLYCALYTEDYEIHTDPLLECWTVEGFIHDASEFRVARGIGHSILNELISVSLLEKSEKVNHVRMNKVIRTMALNISSRRCNFNILVKPHGGLQKVPDEVEWQQANRISLMDSKLGTLPEMPDCNMLSTLLLQRNRELKEIPDLFFQYMQNLRVLDLHGTGITLLPSTISVLKCLRALYLHSCISLMELHLNGLEHLEVLDIRDTGLNHFPIQIRHLIQLKCLRMSLSNFGIRHSSDVESCRDVFSSLYLLEELQIIVDSNNQSWELTVKAISEGVATLMQLTSLSICFPTVDCLKSFISTSHLWKVSCFTFQFSVGYHDTALYKILGCFEYQNMNCLKFANGEGVDPIISEVLLKTHAFELIGHKGASRLSDFGVDSINKMQGCLIDGCNEIETIVDGNNITGSALICLEKMLINNVPNLKTIWEGPVHYGSLSQLTILTLCKCLNLKMIFSSGMIKELSKLQHLEVEECPEIEEIITESENIGLEPDVLPRLKMLVLSNLPRVKRIWTSDSLKWPSLESIKISMCQILTKLPFNNENAINLRCIEADQSWWSALECQDDAIKQRLSSIWFQSP
ncbi:probable disease resistance protein At1g61300 isoform X2 [Quercus lobata]|nr:probable disease resistance protein At1g61300 isoform X2 [Quercus lobata]